MTQPLISVIMPVYNAEDYLEEALTSLVGQQGVAFEAELIDDGSTDASAAILAAFARRDPRLHVTRVQNGGQAKARQVGISQATGDFITFMDSDDIVLPTWLATMAATIGDADIANVNYYTYLAATKTQIPHPYHEKSFAATGDDVYRYWLTDTEMRGYLWNKLFRAALFADPLPVAPFNLMEDSYLIGQLLPQVAKINFRDEPVYNYRFNPSSSVHSKFHPSDLEAINQLGAMYLTLAEEKPALTAVAVRKYAALSLFVLAKMNAAQLIAHWGYVQQLGSVLSDYSSKFAKEVDAKEAAELTKPRPQIIGGSLHGHLAAWSQLIGLPTPAELKEKATPTDEPATGTIDDAH